MTTLDIKSHQLFCANKQTFCLKYGATAHLQHGAAIKFDRGQILGTTATSTITM